MAYSPPVRPALALAGLAMLAKVESSRCDLDSGDGGFALGTLRFAVDPETLVLGDLCQRHTRFARRHSDDFSILQADSHHPFE